MSNTPQRAAARLVDRHGLPPQLTPHLALLVPANTSDPLAYLQAAVAAPTHESLLPFIGNDDAMILRLCVLATRPVADCHYRLCREWEKHLITTALSYLGELVFSIHDRIDDIPKYVYYSVRNVVHRELDWLKRLRQNGKRSLIEIKQPDNLTFFEQVCDLYLDFYGCVRAPLQQQILEARWNYPHGLEVGCKYASEIADELGIPVATVVEELELLQRRYLRLVNDRRQSRNNRNFPALKAQPIKRIHKPLTIQDLESMTDDPSILNNARPPRRSGGPQTRPDWDSVYESFVAGRSVDGPGRTPRSNPSHRGRLQQRLRQPEPVEAAVPWRASSDGNQRAGRDDSTSHTAPHRH